MYLIRTLELMQQDNIGGPPTQIPPMRKLNLGLLTALTPVTSRLVSLLATRPHAHLRRVIISLLMAAVSTTLLTTSTTLTVSLDYPLSQKPQRSAGVPVGYSSSSTPQPGFYLASDGRRKHCASYTSTTLIDSLEYPLSQKP
jgi:hypothetical protein